MKMPQSVLSTLHFVLDVCELDYSYELSCGYCDPSDEKEAKQAIEEIKIAKNWLNKNFPNPEKEEIK